ncbi:polyprotein [Aurantiochytrium single-stranded RNA virus 01]|uniref:Polyprotein n=1 Tax=Aurantiochytrium single-stranded RNA virus 01 TaxID=674971 RepID=Q33DY4_9VIRU|nr:polyprotein [Aurantiochytrium single-stranded RNA virus 01]BAE47143.1 polyprotein [Aurantiochytrium single-stranded RNA virus 01]
MDNFQSASHVALGRETAPFSNVKVNYADFLLRLQQSAEVVDLSSLKELFTNVFSDVTEEGTNFALSLMSLFYRLYKLDSLTDLFFAALDFLKSVCGVNYLVDSAQFAFDFLKTTVTNLYNKLLVAPATTESAAVDVLRNLRSNMSLVLNSDIVSAIRDFVLTLVTFRVFNKDTAFRITQTLGRARPATAVELAEICLSTAISVLNFSDQLMSGASLSEIFCDKNPVAAFTSLADELDSLRALTYSGIPEDGKVCRREYLSRVIKCVKDGEALMEDLPRNAPQRPQVQRSLKTVRLIKSDFLNMMTGESRPMPFCVCLVGMPGIGKGLLVDYVSMIWSHVKGREFDSSHVYHRQATEEYWSGYEPASKPIIHYSEPGSLNRNIAKARGDPVMSEFLSVADNQPFMCNMADVDSKGTVFACPELIVMDTNEPTMNLDVLVNNPAAVRRRILYITPTVKPEFLATGTCRMDQAKSLASDTPKLDRWTFTVHSMEPKDTKTSHTVMHLQGASIYELSDYLRARATKHVEQQAARCDLLSGENISMYLTPTTPVEAVVESSDLSPVHTEELPRSVAFALAYQAFFINLEHMFWEWICALGPLVYWTIVLIFEAIFALILWFHPQNFFLKSFSLAMWRGRLKHTSDKHSRSWNHFKATMGLENTYTPRIQPDYKVARYVAVLGGLLLLVKSYRAFSLFTEGSVLSTQKNWSEEEVDAALERVQRQSKCDMPPPREKRGNGVDWDDTDRPIPVPIDNQEQKNEPDKVVASVMKNLRVMQIAGTRTIETRILGVCEDYALVNRHSICHDKNGVWEATIRVAPDHEIGVIKCTLDSREFVQVDEDVWLIRIRGARFKDIKSYFASDYVTPPAYGSDGFIGHNPVRVKSYAPITAQDKNWGPVHVSRPLAYEWPSHAVGLCGTPLILKYSNAFGIVGLHIAGSNGHLAFSQAIRFPDVAKALNTLSATTCSLGVNSEGRLRLPKKISGLGPVTDRSPLRWEQVAGLSVYGGLVGYQAMKLGKSKLRSSGFIRHAEELTGVSPFKDGKPLYGAPPFSPGFNPNTGEYQGPYNHFVKKCGVVKKSLHPEILRQTIDTVREHILSGLKAKGVTKIAPVTLEVAQNGHPEDFYMRAMKPSTSGGWAWPGSKKKYSEQCSLDFKSDAYMPLYDVKEQVVEQLLAYERGEDALPLLGAQLKDEPRAYKKIVDRKTRVFCMSPYESTLVNRMYLMPFYTLMVEHGDIFRTAIGINMHSQDVGDLVTRMTDFSDQFMEGDYGGYDTSMPYDIGLAANTVVYQVCQDLGYDSHALQMVRGILSDNLYPTVVMRGDVFAAPALQPSGKYATAEDNSLRGLILMVYAWISECTDIGDQCTGRARTTQFQPEDFFTQVLPVIYGDDMLAGVKPVAQQFYNNNTYQTFCKEVYGLEFTNAQKTAEMANFLEWDDTSFLKRSFVFREDLQVWVAQLELASIMKSICYYLPSKSVNEDDQLIDSCVSAMRELFFHLPKEEFEVRRTRFAEVCADLFNKDATDVLKVFPSFDCIRQSLYGVPT